MKLFKNILFSAIIITLFFAFLEVQQRVRYYIKTKDIEYFCYGHSGFEIHLENFLFRIRNSFRRFRDKSGPATGTRYTLKIDAFGGSTTKYSKIKEEFNYPEQLERMIKEKYPGLAVQVTNRGVPGSNSASDLRNMQIVYNKFENIPDIAIIYTGLNDSLRLWRYKQKKDEVMVYKFITTSFTERLDATFKKYSFFYLCLKEYLMKKKYGDINKYYASVKDNYKRIEYKMSPEEEARYIDEVILKDYRKNLESILYMCRTFNITPILGTTPTKNDNTETMPTENKTLERIYDEMRKISKERNVILVDVRRYFVSLKDTDRYFTNKGDNIHVDEAGNEIVASLFLKSIEDNDLLNRHKAGIKR